MGSRYDHRYSEYNTHPIVDNTTMTMVVKLRVWMPLEDDPTDGDEVITRKRLPCKFITCYSCDGKGKHVNPDIDSHGLTEEDFERDPQFREDYFKGRYDVTCYNCAGKRVIPAIDKDRLSPEEAVLVSGHEKLKREEAEYEAEYAAMVRSERLFGC